MNVEQERLIIEMLAGFMLARVQRSEHVLDVEVLQDEMQRLVSMDGFWDVVQRYCRSKKPSKAAFRNDIIALTKLIGKRKISDEELVTLDAMLGGDDEN